eukprot:GHVP01059248.1.p1 GENE.GHVP01059248.1~~GHVP01059248.1.p1  ORF type:complete len:349 (+),score=83.42 GHVP01059248.1:150-1049(+)
MELCRLVPKPFAILQLHVARDQETGDCIGYAHIEFQSRPMAQEAMSVLTGKSYPNNPNRVLLVSWSPRNLSPQVELYQVFVGKLPEETTDSDLLLAIQKHIPNIKAAKVIIDSVTRRSRCFGFARFEDEMEAEDAVIRMQIKGLHVLEKPVTVKLVDRKGQGAGEAGCSVANTENLKNLFKKYGKIKALRYLFMRNQVFVTFHEHIAAISAMCDLDGVPFKGQTLSVVWGRLGKNLNFKLKVDNEEENDEFEEYVPDSYLPAKPKTTLKRRKEEKEEKKDLTEEERKTWAQKLIEADFS